MTSNFFSTSWGDIATLIGLLVSIWVLIVARKAKEAADAVRAEAHLRNISEDLLEMQRKSEQVGIFISENKWDVVYLRAQEVAGACSVVKERWRELSEESKKNILAAQIQFGEIARVAVSAKAGAPSTKRVLGLSKAHQAAHDLVSAELGIALGAVERSKS